MSVSTEFTGFVLDLFAPLGAIAAKRMFGGVGIFRGAAMFALISNDAVFLKVGDGNRADFEAKGKRPFTYERKDGRSIALSFYPMPEDLFDDADEAASWAARALEEAERNVARRAKTRRRKPDNVSRPA